MRDLVPPCLPTEQHGGLTMITSQPLSAVHPLSTRSFGFALAIASGCSCGPCCVERGVETKLKSVSTCWLTRVHGQLPTELLASRF